MKKIPANPAKPSVGLEPTTPSLPSPCRRFRLFGACRFMLQIAAFRSQLQASERASMTAEASKEFP